MVARALCELLKTGDQCNDYGGPFLRAFVWQRPGVTRAIDIPPVPWRSLKSISEQ